MLSRISKKAMQRVGALALALCFILPVSAQDTVALAPRKPHSANKALTLSLLPGAGQVYNRQAWKIPIIYAALGTTGYFTYDYYRQMQAFKEDYLSRVNEGLPLLEEYANYPTANIYNLYQNYSKNFQLFIFIDIAVYSLNLIDAYVFGHLFDFEMDDNLALLPNFQYHPFTGFTPGMSFTLRF